MELLKPLDYHQELLSFSNAREIRSTRFCTGEMALRWSLSFLDSSLNSLRKSCAALPCTGRRSRCCRTVRDLDPLIYTPRKQNSIQRRCRRSPSILLAGYLLERKFEAGRAVIISSLGQ